MSVALYHGDALDMFRDVRGLASIVSKREVHPPVLDGVVTRRAEANEIREVVGVVRGGERPHWPNVVNVQRSPRGYDLAPSARPTVAGAGCALRGAPGRAVILRMSSLPRRVIGALTERVAARERAEVQAGLPQSAPLWILECRSAVGTRERAQNTRPLEFLGSLSVSLFAGFRESVWCRNYALGGARRAALVMALSRAEERPMLWTRRLGRGALHDNPACGTGGDYCGAGKGRRYGGVPASAGARLLAPYLDPVPRRRERLLADLTSCLNQFGHVESLSHEQQGCQ